MVEVLIFLLAIWTPACASSSPVFHMMYSAFKLKKQGDNIQPWHTPFTIWNHSVVSCLVLTVASCPAYRFIRRELRWSDIPISLRIFQFVVIYKVKVFGGINKGEVDIFWNFLLFRWSNGCWKFIFWFLCLFWRVDKLLQKQWWDRAKEKVTPSCGCDWWWN